MFLLAHLLPLRWSRDAQTAAANEARATAVRVRFQRGEKDLASPPPDLPQVRHRAIAGSSIVVIGLARELAALEDNLALAEQRARAIARQLVDLGIVRERIVVAAAESGATAEDAWDCEVRFMAGSPGP
jgi:hypothetical protein